MGGDFLFSARSEIVVRLRGKRTNTMNIMKKSLMLVAIALGAASGIDIPQTNCEWKGADDGVMNTCDGNEIPVGACGSGSFDDCSGQFTQARWVTMNEIWLTDMLGKRMGHGLRDYCLPIPSPFSPLAIHWASSCNFRLISLLPE